MNTNSKDATSADIILPLLTGAEMIRVSAAQTKALEALICPKVILGCPSYF